jgi:hypothetical protein
MRRYTPSDAVKIRLIHVTPASTFCNSETSIGSTRQPARSRIPAVSGNDDGMTTVFSMASTSARVGGAQSPRGAELLGYVRQPYRFVALAQSGDPVVEGHVRFPATHFLDLKRIGSLLLDIKPLAVPFGREENVV